VQQVQGQHIRHFTNLVLRRVGWPEQVLAIVGQPYQVLLPQLAQVAPELFYVASLVEEGAG